MSRLVPARLLAALQPDASVPFELPGDVTREARRRVCVAALLGALGYGTFLTVLLALMAQSGRFQRSLDLTHDVLGLGICLALLAVAIARPVPDRFVMRTALVVQVLLAVLISTAATWAGFLRTAHVSSPAWLLLMIILFPLLIPVGPRTALVVSVLCGLTLPGSLWWLSARGAIEADASDYWRVTSAAAVAVAIATIAARTVHGARRQAAAARQIGSYELLERLGTGGMGEVWKARHVLLARPAAVKRIRPETLQGPMEERDAVVKRFLREAQVTAGLRSPHTVELFDFGVAADGTFYYAMEMLEGMNLEHFVYQFGALEPRRAVHWLRQACHSLGEAHARGLVHRDIKPANLFICRYGRDDDFLKVLDFGLTRVVTTSEHAATTAVGPRMGTPGYMAPEQVFGLALDARADLYALGCVAYWLLAGARPFESDQSGELMRLHVQSPPPPLASRARQAVPARLEAVVMACLAKEPGDRPASADALERALAGALDDGAWSADEARAWWERHLPPARPGPVSPLAPTESLA
jgi:serine/threonine-protein kinase